MALKPRYRRRIFWTIIGLIGAIALAIIIVPPMITLNGFKPIIEQKIYEQTNVPAKLDGNIHFSLIGGATIVAHDVNIPNAKIGSVMFSIPFYSFFNIQNAKLDDAVVIYDADITIDKLAPAMFNHDIEIYNSRITFNNRHYYIIRADFTDGAFHGVVRTNEHKYDIEFIGDKFHIKNKNNNLDIIGQMYSDGSVSGKLSLNTDNVNEWLGFSNPKIQDKINLTADFKWDGQNGYKITNIIADNFSGNVERFPNGDNDIQIVSNDTTFDLTFLLTPARITHKTTFNLDLYGDLILDKHKFSHIKLNAIATKSQVKIIDIIADDITISGGTITPDGAHNIMIKMPIDGITSTCLFSGTPDTWHCDKFTYGDMSGTISVNGDKFNITVNSTQPMPSGQDINKLLARIGKYGTIRFKFSNIGGTYTIDKTGITPRYDYAKNTTLKQLNIDMPFLPPFMLSDIGDITWEQDMMTFTPHNKSWQLSMYNNYFYLTGTSFKTWVPNIDLQSIEDAPYSISGFYNKPNISNLDIKINNHEFFGSATNSNITLHTNTLDADRFMNRDFFDNFAQMEFLANAPILIPFDLPINISLSADALIYDGNEYNNFVYSLKPNTQTFSISDSDRGNLLATIERNKTNYDIFIQMNRFLINGQLLSQNMPLNIRDTMITAEMELHTHGQIAHDIYYNAIGNMDISFDGGYLIGMSFDNFYASAENITTLNAEYALAKALGSGETKIKHMHIIGEYNHDNFITTKPITLSMRHTDAIGGIAITNGQMTAEFDLTMRGTAPTPATIQLSVLPDGGRKYSLTEIMRDIDVGFMRAFVRTHDKF